MLPTPALYPWGKVREACSTLRVVTGSLLGYGSFGSGNRKREVGFERLRPGLCPGQAGAVTPWRAAHDGPRPDFICAETGDSRRAALTQAAARRRGGQGDRKS